jgi:hypothetical protein
MDGNYRGEKPLPGTQGRVHYFTHPNGSVSLFIYGSASQAAKLVRQDILAERGSYGWTCRAKLQGEEKLLVDLALVELKRLYP